MSNDGERELLEAIFAKSRALTTEMAKEHNVRFGDACRAAYEVLKERLGTLENYPRLGDPDSIADPPDSDFDLMRKPGSENFLVTDYMALDGAIAVLLRLVRDDYPVQDSEGLIEEIKECIALECVEGETRW